MSLIHKERTKLTTTASITEVFTPEFDHDDIRENHYGRNID